MDGRKELLLLVPLVLLIRKNILSGLLSHLFNLLIDLEVFEGKGSFEVDALVKF